MYICIIYLELQKPDVVLLEKKTSGRLKIIQWITGKFNKVMLPRPLSKNINEDMILIIVNCEYVFIINRDISIVLLEQMTIKNSIYIILLSKQSADSMAHAQIIGPTYLIYANN